MQEIRPVALSDKVQPGGKALRMGPLHQRHEVGLKHVAKQRKLADFENVFRAHDESRSFD